MVVYSWDPAVSRWRQVHPQSWLTSQTSLNIEFQVKERPCTPKEDGRTWGATPEVDLCASYMHMLLNTYTCFCTYMNTYTHMLFSKFHLTKKYKFSAMCCPSIIMYIASPFFIVWQTASHVNDSHPHSCPERLRLSFQYLCCYSWAVRVEASFAKICAIHWLLHRSFLLWKIIFKMHYICLCCGILV